MLNYLLIRIYVNLFQFEASGLYFQVGLSNAIVIMLY